MEEYCGSLSGKREHFYIRGAAVKQLQAFLYIAETNRMRQIFLFCPAAEDVRQMVFRNPDPIVFQRTDQNVFFLFDCNPDMRSSQTVFKLV